MKVFNDDLGETKKRNTSLIALHEHWYQLLVSLNMFNLVILMVGD